MQHEKIRTTLSALLYVSLAIFAFLVYSASNSWLLTLVASCLIFIALVKVLAVIDRRFERAANTPDIWKRVALLGSSEETIPEMLVQARGNAMIGDTTAFMEVRDESGSILIQCGDFTPQCIQIDRKQLSSFQQFELRGKQYAEIQFSDLKEVFQIPWPNIISHSGRDA